MSAEEEVHFSFLSERNLFHFCTMEVKVYPAKTFSRSGQVFSAFEDEFVLPMVCSKDICFF